MSPNGRDLKELELALLLEGIARRYGYDFRDYAPASLKRRVWKCLQEEECHTISGFQEKILHNPGVLERFLRDVSIGVTAMFRDPGFYRSFREKVVPLLRSLPFFRVWHAGCATGEEVYAMAILLNEEGLYDKCRIYATDLSGSFLETARAGIFPAAEIKKHTANYIEAGGTRSFSEYYTARYDNVIMSSPLQKNIVWAQHNLVTDGSFNEFNVIFCRNVMIYFNQSLQNRVHTLFYDSLAMSGILGLGGKESLHFTPHEEEYKVLDERQRLFRKVK